MSGKSATAGPSVLLVVGLALLLAGQAWLNKEPLFGVCTTILGVLLLLGGAVRAYRQRRGHRPQARLMGEEAGVLSSEEGFIPMRPADEAQRRQVQKRIIDKPDRAADSVRGFLVEQAKQAKAVRPEPAPGKRSGKRRKSDG